jgi:hypothetical protein
VMERCRSVYCDACCASDTNWFELVWVASVSAELELDDELEPPLPPRLNSPRLMPPLAPTLALYVWLLSTCCRALESLLFCCW